MRVRKWLSFLTQATADSPPDPDAGSVTPFFRDDLLWYRDENGLERIANAEFTENVYGQWLMDPNEVNGWGVLGPYDVTNTQDLGDADGNPNPLNSGSAGGFSFPFDVRLKRFRTEHRVNNADSQAWGWMLWYQQKTNGNNTSVGTLILDEVADNGGVGPRDYPNNQNNQSDITTFDEDVIPANHVIVLAVKSPTAIGTNRYVQIKSGYLLFERISP